MGSEMHMNFSIEQAPTYNLSPTEFQAIKDTALKVCATYNAADLLRNTNELGLNLTNVGKFRFEEMMQKVCSSTNALLITVYWVHEYGECGIDYYLSGMGFSYRDRLVPKFSQTKHTAALKERKIKNKATFEAAMKSYKTAKSAWDSMTPEQRTLLGAKEPQLPPASMTLGF